MDAFRFTQIWVQVWEVPTTGSSKKLGGKLVACFGKSMMSLSLKQVASMAGV